MMMEHQEFIDQFSPYLDDELPAEEKEALERHLGQCKNCRKEFEQFKEMMNVVSGFKPAPVPKNFLRSIQHKIRRRSNGYYFPGNHFYPFGFRVPHEVFSLIMLLILFMLYLFNMPRIQNIRPAPDKKLPPKKSMKRAGAEKEQAAPPDRDAARRKKWKIAPIINTKRNKARVMALRKKIADYEVTVITGHPKQAYRYVMKHFRRYGGQLDIPAGSKGKAALESLPITFKAHIPYGAFKGFAHELARSALKVYLKPVGGRTVGLERPVHRLFFKINKRL